MNAMRFSFRLIVRAAMLVSIGRVAAPQMTPSPEMQRIQKESEEDRRRMMDQLRIASLRQGANGRDPNAPNAANYDESKANPWPDLPDPLKMNDGRPVTSAKMWWEKRRPEIVELFDREIYGRVPNNTPKVTWEVTATSEESVGGAPVITKHLIGHVDNSRDPDIKVEIELNLTTPAKTAGPVPIMMEFGFTRPLPPGIAARFFALPARRDECGGPVAKPALKGRALALPFHVRLGLEKK